MKTILVISFLCCLIRMQAQSDVNNLVQADSIKSEFQIPSSYLFFHPDWDMKNQSLFQKKNYPTLMADYKSSHLPGFFCKMEYKIEQKSKLSPRFRLGSLNYTEWMEGKGEFYTRYQH